MRLRGAPARKGRHLLSSPHPLASILTGLPFAPGGALGALSPLEQPQLQHQAKTLAEVFQRSSSNVEGRNGYLSLRNHQLRGLDHPRKRACLTAVHNFLLTRPDGTAAVRAPSGKEHALTMPTMKAWTARDVNIVTERTLSNGQ